MSHSESAGSGVWKNRADYDLLSDSNLGGCQRAAERGSPSAQLELARFYWTRRSDSKDLIEAYKWYLIASQQISRTSKSVGKSMTMEQMLQAEQMAAEWLKKTNRPSPASIRDASGRSPSAMLRAASE
jgi:TPR repeat protein